MTDCSIDEGKMKEEGVERSIEKFNEGVEKSKKFGMESREFNESELRNMISNELQEQAQEIRNEILEILNNQMIDVILNVLKKRDKVPSYEVKDNVESEKYCNRRNTTRADSLPTKQFFQRNSLLTDLYEIKHIRTIYNVIISTLIILMMYTAIYDIRNTGSPNLAIGTVRRGFAKLPIVLCLWAIMKGSSLSVYAAFHYWATRRFKWAPKSFARVLWDYSWLATMMLYYTMFMVLPARAVLHEDLPVASTMIVLMEQIRLVMKTYGFVRHMAPKFLAYKPHSDEPEPKIPNFSKFLYFMFAPTLIYQDRYPRASMIRWNVVLINFAEVVTIIFFVAIVYERILEPTYQNFGKEPAELGIMALNMIYSTLPGILLFLSGFYCLLHSWMNAFAELLRFADKMFYKDWWNSSSYSTYYRTWNIVVHDWLYTYIYKDMYEILTARNRMLSTCAVFVISAFVHEYILSFTFRFFYPVLLLIFGGMGLTILFFLRSAGNVFLWFTLSVGNGALVSLYCMEYFARINCPPIHDDIFNFIIPRSWVCLFD
ncbi:sterol O-acyltransferase 1 [Colletes gigas]|uniref:sterol O-acyltransferase 1 n=1 Tax=Colletes gigas TaxID=935657 RepID=UPI001C9B7D7D|nr:sterol O-acyltransferase 1 [Colletes gigas]